MSPTSPTTQLLTTRQPGQNYQNYIEQGIERKKFADRIRRSGDFIGSYHWVVIYVYIFGNCKCSKDKEKYFIKNYLLFPYLYFFITLFLHFPIS